MGDAEVIPIGTRGRPGRGTGQAKPSSAARNLAGSASRTPSAKKVTPPSTKPVPADVPEAGADEATGAAATTSGTTAVERTPGIPVGDWLHAVSHAAREVFGDNWEPRLAEFLAFLRRRVTGDYTVDEYGFDAEVTERFLISALRPIAEKWFRIEVRGIENIPSEGGALVVSNHSGTIPVDGLMTMVSIHDATGRFLRPLGLVPLPSKWILEFGEPIRTDSYDEHAADDPMLVYNVTDQVRETIQQTLYQLLMKRESVFR